MTLKQWMERFGGVIGAEVDWENPQFMALRFPLWVQMLNQAYERVWNAWPWAVCRTVVPNYELSSSVVPWAELENGSWAQASLPAEAWEPGACVVASQYFGLGLYVAGAVDGKVLLQYRAAAPVFSAVVWVSGTSYVAGDVVYHSGLGQGFRALVNAPGSDFTNAAKWKLLPMHDVLVPMSLAFAKAEWLDSQGQHEAGTRELGRAEMLLDEAMLRERQPMRVSF